MEERDKKKIVKREVKGILKFGDGSLVIQGCILWDRFGLAYKTNGRMDKKLYVQILENELLETLEKYGLEVDNIIFQQDNDSKYISKVVRKWL